MAQTVALIAGLVAASVVLPALLLLCGKKRKDAPVGASMANRRGGSPGGRMPMDPILHPSWVTKQAARDAMEKQQMTVIMATNQTRMQKAGGGGRRSGSGGGEDNVQVVVMRQPSTMADRFALPSHIAKQLGQEVVAGRGEAVLPYRRSTTANGSGIKARTPAGGETPDLPYARGYNSSTSTGSRKAHGGMSYFQGRDSISSVIPLSETHTIGGSGTPSDQREGVRFSGSGTAARARDSRFTGSFRRGSGSGTAWTGELKADGGSGVSGSMEVSVNRLKGPSGLMAAAVEAAEAEAAALLLLNEARVTHPRVISLSLRLPKASPRPSSPGGIGAGFLGGGRSSSDELRRQEQLQEKGENDAQEQEQDLRQWEGTEKEERQQQRPPQQQPPSLDIVERLVPGVDWSAASPSPSLFQTTAAERAPPAAAATPSSRRLGAASEPADDGGVTSVAVVVPQHLSNNQSGGGGGSGGGSRGRSISSRELHGRLGVVHLRSLLGGRSFLVERELWNGGSGTRKRWTGHCGLAPPEPFLAELEDVLQAPLPGSANNSAALRAATGCGQVNASTSRSRRVMLLTSRRCSGDVGGGSGPLDADLGQKALELSCSTEQAATAAEAAAKAAAAGEPVAARDITLRLGGSGGGGGSSGSAPPGTADATRASVTWSGMAAAVPLVDVEAGPAMMTSAGDAMMAAPALSSRASGASDASRPTRRAWEIWFSAGGKSVYYGCLERLWGCGRGLIRGPRYIQRPPVQGCSRAQTMPRLKGVPSRQQPLGNNFLIVATDSRQAKWP
ncbi:hypothetical protein VOLCADRAFT_96453 [Volvox carteri f. nagariensis]|uniref:Uncharacterized protein n=1 Tax=Volvox carteri f. nagariensis TaxID=3068 RepID=D8UA54_VOLCA|nr:uncharacterized protein VOLCADRAFT_96453 [Volvox carteri f. nagariensis]EFJ43415.1 hypothetical protein VOLCADRAFT_96453 [Volvox carteri f. nagariensis]|eukprot:XP_002955562.1 hypothetical protein VOLCADRAFT_96453 [Volvox carteri f. nagariensis]